MSANLDSLNLPDLEAVAPRDTEPGCYSCPIAAYWNSIPISLVLNPRSRRARSISTTCSLAVISPSHCPSTTFHRLSFPLNQMNDPSFSPNASLVLVHNWYPIVDKHFHFDDILSPTNNLSLGRTSIFFLLASREEHPIQLFQALGFLHRHVLSFRRPVNTSEVQPFIFSVHQHRSVRYQVFCRTTIQGHPPSAYLAAFFPLEPLLLLSRHIVLLTKALPLCLFPR
eukprot:g47583.t1